MGKRPFFSRITGALRAIDLYGHPINLTYKGETTYKSLVGAFFTIITRIGILTFFVLEIINVINKDS